MASQLIEIDTKEICLLCYDPCFKKGHSNDPVISSSSLRGFKQLLRYLKVNTKELFNCSPEFLQWMEVKHEIDVQITICEKCSSVTEKFHILYKQYELIQLQFDKCVASLHQSMKTADENNERVYEFKKQMRSKNSADFINASIAANLRNTTFQKCELKLQNSTPRVALQHTSCSSSAKTPKVLDSALKFNFSYSGTTMNEETETDTHNQLEIRDVKGKTDDKAPISGFKLSSPSGLPKRKRYLSNSKENREIQDQDSFHFINAADVSVSVENNLKIVAVTSHQPEDHQFAFENTNSIANDDSITFAQLSESSEGEISRSFRQVDEVEMDNTLESSICTASSKRRRRTPSAVRHPKWIRKVMENNNLNCTVCQTSFANAKSLSCHYYVKHSEYVVSGSYNSKFSRDQWKTKLNVAVQHAQSISLSSDGKGGFNCCYCQAHVKYKSDYKYHLLRLHANEIVSQVDPSSSKQSDSISSKVFAHKCEYCEYASNSSSNAKFHLLDMHTVDIVWPLLNPGTSKVKCGQATEAILDQLKNRDGQCPKCSSKLTQSAGLRRHMLGQHFEEFVQDVKKYLSQQDTQVVVGGDDVEYGDEMILPIEFGEENVKVELMPNTCLGQEDPLGYDD